MKSGEYNLSVVIPYSRRLRSVVIGEEYFKHKDLVELYGAKGFGWYVAIRLHIANERTQILFMDDRLKLIDKIKAEDEFVLKEFYEALFKKKLLIEFEGLILHPGDYLKWCSQNLESLERRRPSTIGTKRGATDIFIEELTRRKELVEFIQREENR
jgi:hypothetical protein